MNIFTRHRSREVRSREIPSRVYHACGVAAYFAGSTRICTTLSILATFIFFAFASPSERDLPRRSKDFALFIAVNDYQHWGKLKHPIGEVEKIAAELYQNYEFDTLILRNPSQDQIVSALRSYNRTYPDDGQLLIYLSGHGSFDEQFKEGFFIPREGRLNDAAQTSYLSFSRLQRIVESIPCRHILLAIDACYSGTFDRLVALRGENEIIFSRPGALSDVRSNYIKSEMTLQSRFFIASGKKEQTPDASNFAAYFLRALRNGGRDHNILTMPELVAELKKAQPKPHVSIFAGHQDEGNFLFVKKLSAPIASDAIHNARQDLADWQEAQRLNTAAAYRNYLGKQSRGEFRSLAEQNAKSLEAEEREIAAWNNAKSINTCDAYKNFLRDYPQSAYRPLAEEAEKRQCAPSTTAGMALIKGGTFSMGCTSEQKDCDSDESPVTRVKVSDFYLGKHEVTFDEYDTFCIATGKIKPSDSGWGRGQRPVINVSWNDAIAYCNWRSEKEGLSKVYTISGSTVTANWNANGYRLPTEAEWEYAARGGGKAVLFGNGKDIADPREINFDASASYKKSYSVAGEYPSKTVPVGSLNSPNALGLHDMSGNVWEWCWNWQTTYPGGERKNYRGPDSGSFRVIRGGSWSSGPQGVRVADRSNAPGLQGRYLGFRLARAVK